MTTRAGTGKTPREIRAAKAVALAIAYLPAIATFAVVTAVGIAGGGFHPDSWRFSTVAPLALAGATLTLRERIALGRREWAMLAALGGLGAWTAASALWSIHPSNSVLESERVLLYVVGLAVVLLALEGAALPQVVAGAVAGMTAVSLVGLREQYLVAHPLSPIEGNLLFQPLGYANALGMYAAIGILLAVGLALWARPWPARAAALAPCLVLVPTLALTSSRGAWVALAIGMVAMLHFGRRVRSRSLLLTLLAAGVVAGVLIGSNKGQNLSILGQYRPHYWHVALDEYAANPVLGGGAGTFGDYFWRFHRPAGGFTLTAHSAYLESLAELGPLGLALLAGALCFPLVDLRRRLEPLTAAAGGAYVAFLVHAAIDWDWKVPALTMMGLFCGAAVLVGTRNRRAHALSGRTRAVLFASAMVLAALALLRLETGPGLGS